MTRSIIYASLVAFALTAAALPAAAQEQATKHVGIGFIVGEPTGISLKMFLNNTNALDFAAAWSLSGNNDFHLQGDYLFHKYDLIDLQNSDDFPLFFGVGLRMVLIEDFDDVVGIRFPVGLDYLFANYPFDIFAEIVPILDVAPDSDFDLEGAIGARFWF